MENTSSQSPGDAGQIVKETVSQGAQQASQVVSQVTDQAKQQAQSMLSGQKGQLTEGLSQLSAALSQTGDTLREQKQTAVAGLADQAATRLDGIASYFESRDLGQLASEAENFARRNTGLFLGGALALGVIAARFLKSQTPSIGTGPGSGGNYPGGPGSYGYRSGPGYGSPGAYSQGNYAAEPSSDANVASGYYGGYEPTSAAKPAVTSDTNGTRSTGANDVLTGSQLDVDFGSTTDRVGGSRTGTQRTE